MGGIVSLPSHSTQEVFAIKAVQLEYEWLSQSIIEQSELKSYLIDVYLAAMEDFSLSSPFLCHNPATIILKLKETDSIQLDNEIKSFRSTLDEAERKKIVVKVNTDYSQGFSGTKADTDAEKDFAKMLRPDEERSNNINSINFPVLNPPAIRYPQEEAALRAAGKWIKYLGSIGCYMYIHLLTRSVVSIKPDDYVEELDTSALQCGVEEVKDPANGLMSCSLADLPLTLEQLRINGNTKTPLILDGTLENLCMTFFSIKGMLADVSSLVVPYAISGVKRSDIMERCRTKLVSALKTGGTFVLYLGGCTIEHADFKKKLCKKDVFPVETFQTCGERLMIPKRDPMYKALYREEDLESGQAIVRDGYRVLCISTLSPYDYEQALCDSLPLGYMIPIYVFK